MGISVTINGITGTSPFDVYICQSNGSGCFYIDTISTTTYFFEIPPPYDTATSYMVKVIDADNCTISGISSLLWVNK